MPDQPIIAHIADRPVYRRSVTRADGRHTLFYGFAPHSADPVPEEPTEVAKGGELRWHPFRQEWNIYAPHRQNRTFKPSAALDPLAPSRLGHAPTDIPFTDFDLCIFENKFTSLHAEAPAPNVPDGMKAARALGRCDVVVYGPEATGNLWSIGQDKRRLLLAAWIDRYASLYAAGHAFVLPFENRGDAVGVTLSHPHGQIYSFPFVPDIQAKAAQTFVDGYDLAADLKRFGPDYIVAEAGGIVAWCPPYARFPFECWIVPQRKVAGPWDLTETEQDGFAFLLGEMTRRYDAYFGQDTAAMMSVQAAPGGPDSEAAQDWHMSAQFFPLLRAPGRTKFLASVEQTTGVFTVDVMPEFAAKALREQAHTPQAK